MPGGATIRTEEWKAVAGLGSLKPQLAVREKPGEFGMERTRAGVKQRMDLQKLMSCAILVTGDANLKTQP